MKVILLVNTAAAGMVAKNLLFFKVTICDFKRLTAPLDPAAWRQNGLTFVGTGGISRLAGPLKSLKSIPNSGKSSC